MTDSSIPRSGSPMTETSFEALLECHNESICARIQMVPQEFCSAHQATLPPASLRIADQSTINKFTKKRSSVGIWPPRVQLGAPKLDTMTSQTSSSSSQFNSAVDKHICPSHNRITMLHYECASGKQIECVKCLIQHTEVFLACNADALGGYI